MKKAALFLIMGFVAISWCAGTVHAHATFKKPFEEKYVKSSTNADFKTGFRKAGCYVCHVKGKPKEWLNGYGLQLAKHLPGNAKERLAMAKAISRDAYKTESEKMLEELKEALKKAEKGKTKDGLLYGDLLKEEKLPTDEGARSLYDPPDEENEKADSSDADD